MSTPKPTTRVWEARTGTGLHPDLLAYSHTIHEDGPFLVHDLAGSSAHVLGLAKAGLLGQEEARQLLDGLRAIHRGHEAGTFDLKVELEDVHMNIESRLTAQLGDVGRRLHTGRSRNDQVATCIVLYARAGLARLAQGLHALSAALAQQAQANLETPWVARTHGMPAQPATAGFLLAAHAHRLQDAARSTLATFEAIGESPLGSGAIAGSTLPLQPAYTAGLLGLRPPRSALLATGTRDAVLHACRCAQEAGVALAGLSQDLLDLFREGALRLPSGYTTGSSLMPQKRNPDALELARGRGKALAGPAAAVSGILSGMGLGYQRDFQLTKPYLVQALGDAAATAELLAPLVEGMQVGAAGAEWTRPGIVATDVAEALVRAGQPFRTAYGTVAKAFALVESGSTFQAALEAQHLAPAHLEAALSALQPDPSRRATMGGPAPMAVQSSLAAFRQSAQDVAARVAAAHSAAEKPVDLLSRPLADLLEA
ncbi:MAG TPA: argininosuccinate lyase [Candidatus Thermoplasmatota archaeon]|nr:argininosuccinate lyase [Candidatus Thermoplasmatota archaeon]